MNLSTIAMFTKGFCLMTGAMAAGIAAGIISADVTTLMGVSVKVWAVFLGAYGIGCNSLVAFLSESFGTWKSQRVVNPGGATPPQKQP